MTKSRRSKKSKEEQKLIKIKRLQSQLDDLKRMSDCKKKRCYIAGCNKKEIRSLCKWIHRAWYDNLNVDDATRQRLKNPLQTREGKRLVSVLADQDNEDLALKRRLLLHRDCVRKLFPVLFKYLVPSVRNILTETIQTMEKNDNDDDDDDNNDKGGSQSFPNKDNVKSRFDKKPKKKKPRKTQNKKVNLMTSNEEQQMSIDD